MPPNALLTPLPTPLTPLSAVFPTSLAPLPTPLTPLSAVFTVSLAPLPTPPTPLSAVFTVSLAPLLVPLVPPHNSPASAASPLKAAMETHTNIAKCFFTGSPSLCQTKSTIVPCLAPICSKFPPRCLYGDRNRDRGDLWLYQCDWVSFALERQSPRELRNYRFAKSR